MRYISKEDLIVNSYEKLIDESSKDSAYILEKLESRAISLVKTYLQRYDTDSIFGVYLEDEDAYTEPLHNALIIDILAKIVLYNLFRRNAARKIPVDIKEDYDWAIKELERIRSGAVVLEDMPPALDDNGQIISNSIWGNNTNTNYYI